MNLSSLTKEEKLLLLDHMEESERRVREKRLSYRPNRGQAAVHACDKTIRVVFSGNGSGKTAMGVNECFWALNGFNPLAKTFSQVPAKVIVVLDSPDKVSEVWLPEIKKWFNLDEEDLKKNGKPYYSEISRRNGSSLRFMFHLQEEMAFESIEADFVIFDEPPPRHVWTGLRRAGRKKNRKPKYLFIGTPLGGAWMRESFYDPWVHGELTDVECFKFGTDVNEKNLADGYIDAFSRHLTEKEKRVRLEGEFFDLDGLALASLFNRKKHILNPFHFESEWPAVVAIDPHPNKKHVALLVGADRDGGLYVIKEMASKSTPRIFAKELKAFFEGYHLIDIVCDSLGATPMSGGDGNKSFIEVMRECGIQARSTRYEDKNDESWLMRIQDALRIRDEGDHTPKLRISPECTRTINDIETVQWMAYKNTEHYKPKLDISQKDFLACLKYALATQITYNRSKSKIYRRSEAATAYGQRKMRGVVLDESTE